jgi:hypothetical protein
VAGLMAKLPVHAKVHLAIVGGGEGLKAVFFFILRSSACAFGVEASDDSLKRKRLKPVQKETKIPDATCAIIPTILDIYFFLKIPLDLCAVT